MEEYYYKVQVKWHNGWNDVEECKTLAYAELFCKEFKKKSSNPLRIIRVEEKLIEQYG
jgi:hypothetical protein